MCTSRNYNWPLFCTIHFQTAISSSQWANVQMFCSARRQRLYLARSQQTVKCRLRGMVGGRLPSSFLQGSIRNETPTHGCPTLLHWAAFEDLGMTSLQLDLVQQVLQISITLKGHRVVGAGRGAGGVGVVWGTDILTDDDWLELDTGTGGVTSLLVEFTATDDVTAFVFSSFSLSAGCLLHRRSTFNTYTHAISTLHDKSCCIHTSWQFTTHTIYKNHMASLQIGCTLTVFHWSRIRPSLYGAQLVVASIAYLQQAQPLALALLFLLQPFMTWAFTLTLTYPWNLTFNRLFHAASALYARCEVFAVKF